jgi:hypothetical protein
MKYRLDSLAENWQEWGEMKELREESTSRDHPFIKRTLTIGIVSAVALFIAGVIGFRAFTFKMWEGTLFGPYTGRAFTGELSSQPTSSLNITSGATLELHESAKFSAPILALRRDGHIEWAHVLQPERPLRDGSFETAGVRKAQLRKRIAAHSGTRVIFSCDWDWGGRESGLIYLAGDQSFDHFGISW